MCVYHTGHSVVDVSEMKQNAAGVLRDLVSGQSAALTQLHGLLETSGQQLQEQLVSAARAEIVDRISAVLSRCERVAMSCCLVFIRAVLLSYWWTVRYLADCGYLTGSVSLVGWQGCYSDNVGCDQGRPDLAKPFPGRILVSALLWVLLFVVVVGVVVAVLLCSLFFFMIELILICAILRAGEFQIGLVTIENSTLMKSTQWWWWCRPHPVREHAQDLRPPLGARPASPPTRQAAQPPPRGPSTNPRPLV